MEHLAEKSKIKPWKNWPGSSEKLCKRVLQALACCLAMNSVFWLGGSLSKQSQRKQRKESIVWPHTWCELTRKYWHQPKTHCGEGKHSWILIQGIDTTELILLWLFSHENLWVWRCSLNWQTMLVLSRLVLTIWVCQYPLLIQQRIWNSLDMHYLKIVYKLHSIGKLPVCATGRRSVDSLWHNMAESFLQFVSSDVSSLIL